MPAVLAVGAFLKNTLCAIDGDQAFLSPPSGNLDTADAIAAFEFQAAQFAARAGWRPEAVAHDLHPDFHSTRWAQSQPWPSIAVQHHHAHIAAVTAEHGLGQPVIGLALDGFGLGPGHQSWGGELLLVDGPDFRRLGHLALLPQPGGDIAARQPWRMASAALYRMGRGSDIATCFADQKSAALLAQMIDRGLNCPPTSSAGRLFDAACGLLGIHPVANFEGQAPMALERLVERTAVLPEGWRIEDGVLDCLPLLARLVGMDAKAGAELFHGTLIAALLDWTQKAAEETGVRTIAMGGGCFFNAVLTQGLREGLAVRGLKALLPQRVSPGDPAISLGQAWIAALSVARAMTGTAAPSI
jgi:hydrogenase maturation protein HypF